MFSGSMSSNNVNVFVAVCVPSASHNTQPVVVLLLMKEVNLQESIFSPNGINIFYIFFACRHFVKINVNKMCINVQEGGLTVSRVADRAILWSLHVIKCFFFVSHYLNSNGSV